VISIAATLAQLLWIFLLKTSQICFAWKTTFWSLACELIIQEAFSCATLVVNFRKQTRFACAVPLASMIYVFVARLFLVIKALI